MIHKPDDAAGAQHWTYTTPQVDRRRPITWLVCSACEKRFEVLRIWGGVGLCAACYEEMEVLQ